MWTNGIAVGASLARIGAGSPPLVHGQGAMSFLGSPQKLRIAHNLTFVDLSTKYDPS